MSSGTKAQIAAVVNCSGERISIMKHKTQNQKGGDDCGVFAIAFAVDLVMGREPAGLRYDQSKMRHHLIQCFEKKLLTPFPSESMRMMKPSKQEIKVFCTCRLPDFEGEEMAECDECGRWYHRHCESVPEIVFEDSEASWICSVCQQEIVPAG